MCDGFEVLETWGPGLPTGSFCCLDHDKRLRQCDNGLTYVFLYYGELGNLETNWDRLRKIKYVALEWRHLLVTFFI